jgi:hypothetical protein
MNDLTLKIKPNDKVRLKYALNKCNNQDPHYKAIQDDLLHFRSREVVVELTEYKHRYHSDTYLGIFMYIHVRDCTGRQGCFPIEYIDRNRNIVRNHKRISLHHKKLIC